MLKPDTWILALPLISGCVLLLAFNCKEDVWAGKIRKYFIFINLAYSLWSDHQIINCVDISDSQL